MAHSPNMPAAGPAARIITGDFRASARPMAPPSEESRLMGHFSPSRAAAPAKSSMKRP